MDYLFIENSTLTDSLGIGNISNVLKVIQNENFKFYEAGKLYFNKKFIPIPYDFNNFSLVRIKDENYYSGKLQLMILVKNESQDFEDIKVLEFDKSHFNSFFNNLNVIFKNLDAYLELGYLMSNFNREKNYMLSRILVKKERPYLNAINNLKLEFYTDSQVRVGKDNYFWKELIITNLPKDFYLKNLIFDALDITISDENIIKFRFDEEYNWSASIFREKIENPLKELEIKDNLKLKIVTTYNEQVHKLSQLVKIF